MSGAAPGAPGAADVQRHERHRRTRVLAFALAFPGQARTESRPSFVGTRGAASTCGLTACGGCLFS